MRRFPFVFALLALVTAADAAQTYRPEYKLSTVLPASYPWGKAGERWAELVKEKTEGRINIKMYPGTSLVGGDQTREFSAIRQGVIDLAIGSTINWSPQVRQLNLFSMPFLMPDHRAVDALTKGEVGKQLFGLLEKSGVVPLAWGENGFRELSNSKGVIASPADMKGKKFRVVGSPIFIDTFTALGANPTQMSFADAQPALSTGAVDGQENPLSVFVGAKMWTFNQRFLTLWGYTADPLVFVVEQGSVGVVDARRSRSRASGRDSGRRGERGRGTQRHRGRRHRNPQADRVAGRDGHAAQRGSAQGIPGRDESGL